MFAMAREGEGKMIDLAAASTAMTQLETALTANAIQVPDGALQLLLDQKEWIYRSQRVEKLLKILNQEQLYSVFNSQHHIQSASHLFEFLKNEGSCVVYGHKVQGKTQFLFFVFKLLQAMGEKVLFLDKTVFPLKCDGKVDLDGSTFCGNLWKDSFQIEGTLKTSLDKFYEDALPKSFGKFIRALRQYARKSGTRVWIIVDDVVLFENFPIDLPEEQNRGPFNWIVTGSAGIYSWVSKKHLEKLVFHLPLFTKEECFDFANSICNSLDINLEKGIDGVPPAGVDDWLEERFGGVVGYIAELFLEISKGNLVSQYMSVLSTRMMTVISNSAERRNISKKELAKDWLNEIKSDENNWACLHDAGLCGSSAPRGIIFSLILKWLCISSPEENALSLISFFSSNFSGDPGLDGCLMEIEETLKLRSGNSIRASLLTCVDQGWIVKESIDLPPRGIPLSFFCMKKVILGFKRPRTHQVHCGV